MTTFRPDSASYVQATDAEKTVTVLKKSVLEAFNVSLLGLGDITEKSKTTEEQLMNLVLDAGAEDIQREEDETLIYTTFTGFGHMAKFLEAKHLDAKSAELQYIPAATKELSEADQDEVLKLVEVLEADDDVQTVYHNLA